MSILDNPRFAELFSRLAAVSQNPRRHTAANVRDHSQAASDLARRLALANACSPAQVELLADLGLCHDLGKLDHTANPAHSAELLDQCGVTAPELLALVRWHDTALPWFQSYRGRQPPSAKAWASLAAEVDLRLLCLFMVADRVDVTGGWRHNQPTVWFIDQARQRELVAPMHLDLPDHPSIVDYAGALVHHFDGQPKLLAARTGDSRFDLPTVAIRWDELPEEAACRAIREAGVRGPLKATGLVGQGDAMIDAGENRCLKRVRCYQVTLPPGPVPSQPDHARWVSRGELETLPLANPSLGPIMQATLCVGAGG
jgi:hypothetical protein